LLSAGIFYIAIFMSVGVSYPWLEFIPFPKPALSNLMAALYSGALGQFLFWLSLAATLAGLFTTWNGFFIAGSRLLLGMGRARLLPSFFATVHPKYNTPYGGSIFCAAAMLAGPFLGIGLVDPLTILGSTGFVVGWGMACLSAVVLYKKAPDMPRPYRMPGGVATAWTGTIVCALMFLNCVIPGLPGYMGSIGMSVFVAWCALGLVFYVSTSKYRAAISEEERMAELFKASRPKEAPQDAAG
jgi:amino acid transporter